MRTRTLLATLATVGLLVSGCGGGSASSGDSDGAASASSSPSKQPGHKNHDGMTDMEMSEMDAGTGPSETARMVCEEDEIRDAVKRTFQMDREPTSRHTWSAKDRVYTCDWTVPDGTLRLVVQDATDTKAGRAWFDRLRARVDDARTIKGVESFGFPAFETKAGDVGFLKDGKTLHVDATKLPTSSLPKDFSRSDVAYSVAAAVIGCWTE